jgi:oxygen-independent coproporphyrinogen-3 oxidase
MSITTEAIESSSWTNADLNLGALLDKHSDLKIEHDTYNIAVAAPMGDRLSPEVILERYRNHNGAGKPAHLYFHVPLCNYICHYCNYVKKLVPSNSGKDGSIAYWADILIEESKRFLSVGKWLPEAKIESFFMGGGTAAILLENGHIERLLNHVKENYNIMSGCEKSLEGNPDNFLDGNVQYAKELGFNRFSMGVQSFQNEVNAFVNRGHNAEQSLEAIHNLKKSGLPFNIDMMFGLPYQTVESVEKDIQTLVDLGVPTITIYRLRNADREALGLGNRSAWNYAKVLHKLQEDNMFPDIYTTYEMRSRALRVLLDAGYRPSPCGWWSKPGTYGVGNIPQVSRNKWQNHDTMIAFGPGAYGWLTGGNSDVVQTHNIKTIKSYTEHMASSDTPPVEYGKILTGVQAVATALGFGFQANQPISLQRFKKQFNVDLINDAPYAAVISKLITNRLLEYCNDGAAIRPTLAGEALHSEIIDVEIFGNIGGLSSQMCQKTAHRTIPITSAATA